jgi:dephospho-CoA kinase
VGRAGRPIRRARRDYPLRLAPPGTTDACWPAGWWRTPPQVALLDIPLLYETAGDKRCDAVVVVTAPSDMQRVRAFERPGMTAEKFEAIMAKQTPDTEKRRRADFVVDTSRGMDAARAQVRDILKAIAKMPQRHR